MAAQGRSGARRQAAWMALASVLTWGCSAAPSSVAGDVERCNDYCDACRLGYCTGGGGSGWCGGESQVNARNCILAAADDCRALVACVSGPDAGPFDASLEPDPAGLQRCADYCVACDVGYCVTAGGSGWCSADSRRDCILASEGDCDALSACIMGPAIDARSTEDAGP